MRTVALDPTNTFVAAILTYFIGRVLTRQIPALQRLRIPEAVTGGLVVAAGVALLRSAGSIEVRFAAGDIAMLTVFACIGLHARMSDLLSGGRLLTVALAVTVGTLLVQNAIGIGGATLLGFPPGLGMMAGSVALVGGHGTAAAWSPSFGDAASMAMAVGLAAATFGLVAGGLLGSPVGKALIERHGLRAESPGAETEIGEDTEASGRPIQVHEFFASMLLLAITIAIGRQLNGLTTAAGLTLPTFLTTLFAGIVIGNAGPALAPRLDWPMHKPALVLIADVALSVFLARALMALDLTQLAGTAGVLLLVLLVQAAAVVAIAWFVLFPALGRTYDAAISSAGFVGLALGATPTALANMSSLTHKYGPSARSFVIIPLVGAFFVDLVNAVVITAGLSFLRG